MEEAIELSARHFEILCDSSIDCHALEAIVAEVAEQHRLTYRIGHPCEHSSQDTFLVFVFLDEEDYNISFRTALEARINPSGCKVR
jgi:hypothetical protein